MPKRSLVAFLLTASLAAAPAAPAAAASTPRHDPIAHIALGFPKHQHHAGPRSGKHHRRVKRLVRHAHGKAAKRHRTRR